MEHVLRERFFSAYSYDISVGNDIKPILPAGIHYKNIKVYMLRKGCKDFQVIGRQGRYAENCYSWRQKAAVKSGVLQFF